MTTMLTPHFSLEEMIASQTAARMGLSNMPEGNAYDNVRLTAERMEKVRALLGEKPVLISSGYRSPEVNAATGGSKNSAHMSGLACDFTCPGFGDPHAVAKQLMEHAGELQYDQIIWEYQSWVHIGWSEGSPRLMALTIDNSGTHTGIA